MANYYFHYIFCLFTQLVNYSKMAEKDYNFLESMSHLEIPPFVNSPKPKDTLFTVKYTNTVVSHIQ